MSFKDNNVILIRGFALVFFLSFFIFSFSLKNIYCRISSAKRGGELILASVSDPKSFNPIVAKEVSTTAVTGLMFEGLTKTNGKTLEVEPNLAVSWDKDEEGRVWVFHLRHNIFWSDGEPFTADDVVFTFNRLIYNPDIPTSARDIFTIEGKKLRVEKVDEWTVRVTLPVKFAPFLRSMGTAILPKHILEKSVNEGKFSYTWGLDSNPKDIVGMGPFKIEKYLPGERVVLTRNPYYWQKDSQGNRLPYLDKVIFVIVQNPDVALLQFQEGKLDFYSLRGEDYAVLKPQEKKGNFTVFNTGPAFGTNFLVFNQNTSVNHRTGKHYISEKKLGWFTNPKFRKAAAFAVDRQSIIDIVMNGLGFSQYSSMSPSAGYFYNPDVQKYEYNIKKAKALLKEIGIYDRDNNGLAEDGKGNRIEFNLFTNANSTVRIKIANIIRKDLERLGFKVNFVPLEFNQLVSKVDSTYDWDAVMIGLTGGIEPHFGSNVWKSSGHLHIWYPCQKKPATEWEAEIDSIFDRAVQELDRKKRKALYDKWQMIVSEKLPLIYTVLPANIFAVRNKFGNLDPTSYGGAFYNIEKIYIKPKYFVK